MIPRRSIDELAARYELEPEISDLYVEGAFDKDLMEVTFNKNEQVIYVYEIDTVDIDYELLKKYNLTEGRKQRVIALHNELKEIIGLENKIKFLVDRDLDHWFGEIRPNGSLFYTEYCSIESYFFNNEIIRDITITCAKAKIENWNVYYQSMVDFLRKLYALRLADRELSLGLKWPDTRKSSIRNNETIDLDVDNYVERILSLNNNHEIKKSIVSSYNIWLEKLNGDARFYVRGHDFIELVGSTIETCKGVKNFGETSAIERLLVFYASSTGLLKSLFQQHP